MILSSQVAAQTEALRVAKAIADGEVGIIEGCRHLSLLAHTVVPDWRIDEDFRVFGAVDSETDALPIGSVREGWETDALKREDKKISEAETFYRNAVLSACKNVVDRFEDG